MSLRDALRDLRDDAADAADEVRQLGADLDAIRTAGSALGQLIQPPPGARAQNLLDKTSRFSSPAGPQLQLLPLRPVEQLVDGPRWIQVAPGVWAVRQ